MAFIKFMKGAIVGTEQPKFEVISKTDDYELRSYCECRWVTLSITEKTPDDFSREDFRRLFDYINGKNESGVSIDMTSPVLYHVSPVEEKAKDFSVSFFLPASLESPPSPTDEGLSLSETGPREIFVRTFSGMAKDADWKREFETLKEKIGNPEEADLSEYHRAGYDPPFKPFNRRNEVWIVKKSIPNMSPTE